MTNALRNYYIRVSLNAQDHDEHGVLDEGPFTASRGDYKSELQEVRESLIQREIQSATIFVLDYADDEEGEEVLEEDFDLDEHTDDEEEAA